MSTTRRTQSVLVVEDDAETRELLVDALRDEGFVVIASDEGRKAVELATVMDPAVVLLDLEMPGMDGRTFLERRRTIPRLSDTPVVVITGSAASGVQADAVFPKPFHMPELLETVRRLHRRRS
jgi:CheY-like chemotaxis protein